MAGKSQTPFIFLTLRFMGMGLIALSMIFLFRKSKPPLINILDLNVANGPMGNILLSFGAVLFGVYLLSRIYTYFKNR